MWRTHCPHIITFSTVSAGVSSAGVSSAGVSYSSTKTSLVASGAERGLFLFSTHLSYCIFLSLGRQHGVTETRIFLTGPLHVH